MQLTCDCFALLFLRLHQLHREAAQLLLGLLRADTLTLGPVFQSRDAGRCPNRDHDADQERDHNDALNVCAELNLTIVDLIELLRIGCFGQSTDFVRNLNDRLAARALLFP